RDLTVTGVQTCALPICAKLYQAPPCKHIPKSGAIRHKEPAGDYRYPRYCLCIRSGKLGKSNMTLPGSEAGQTTATIATPRSVRNRPDGVAEHPDYGLPHCATSHAGPAVPATRLDRCFRFRLKRPGLLGVPLMKSRLFAALLAAGLLFISAPAN